MMATYELIQPYVMKAVNFLLGKPHQGMAIAYTLVALNGMATAFINRRTKKGRRRRQKKPQYNFIEKLFAYTIFISLGNMLDMLMLNELTGWEGSSQFVVCLDIIRREGKTILESLEKNYGIGMPILTERFGSLERNRSEQDTQLPTPEETLDRQLQELREELAAIRAGERARQVETPEE